MTQNLGWRYQQDPLSYLGCLTMAEVKDQMCHYLLNTYVAGKTNQPTKTKFSTTRPMETTKGI